MDTSTTASYRDTASRHAHPFPSSSVEHLEALAFLFGVPTPEAAGARVLELGCGTGGNLIPFAARHPDARAMGVDLSQVRLKQGATTIAQARLMNVELRVLDIAGIDAAFGQFDYIVCHDVYSWAPQAVQDAILRVCAENLAPDGAAYVSYNVYPGWKAREMVRDAMILRGAPRDEPDETLSYARGMLEFLDQSVPSDSVLKKALDETLPMVRASGSAELQREFLEPRHSPCYFKEFVERAGARGLSYLADAEPSTMFVQNYGDKVREPLLRECGGSQILMEQYLDFLVNRSFRQTLLVKQARAADIRYRLDPERIRALEFAGVFSAEDGAALTLDTREQRCHAMGDRKLTLRLPIHKAVAQVLDEIHPATTSVETLIAAVSARTGEPHVAVDPLVMAMLEELLILGAVRIRRTAPQAASQVSAFPHALPAVRGAAGLALSAGPAADVCNPWHEPVELSLLERCLLPLLDGGHSHDSLAQHLATEARAERLRFIKDEKPLTDEAALRDFTQRQVALALRDLRRKALLAG